MPRAITGGMGNNVQRCLLWSALIFAVVAVAACNRNSEPDPAAANLAPADQHYAQPYAEPQAAEPEYGQQLAEAPQPPPALPDYTQPECPGENYIWTPGYWNYADAGYYWVPGAWVMAPYVDALWTPPYWDYYGSRYVLRAGYWSRHIGYYGGINYGFGYTGMGFYGGYWDTGGQFVYNRDVTRINTRVVHDYYRHSVVNYTPVNRVSYNGPGGIVRQPVTAELAVRRESRMNALPVQLEHMRSAAVDRSQLAAANRGRPATAALQRPLATSYAAPAPRGQWQGGEGRPRAAAGNGGAEPTPANREPFNRMQPEIPRGEQRGEVRRAQPAPPAMGRPQMAEPRAANPGVREMPLQRPEQRMAPPARPSMPESRGGSERRMEQNPAPQRAPQAPAQLRTPPQPHVEAHPAPPPQQNEARPAPQHQEGKPAPNKEDHGRRGGQ
ncbi:MAG TPA: hypothetical protein VKB88_24465 [Bryobacteraceae bacterium]|nr:hypothetical protein [Bryobacteraceae bacterium]